MSEKLERLGRLITEKFGDRVLRLIDKNDELTLEVLPGDYYSVAEALRDTPEFGFDQLMDLTGVDYSAYECAEPFSGRYSAVVHLLSTKHNVRLRFRSFAADDEFPVLDSLCPIWPSANWFEREAFDLFGIMFAGHSDLRRILTDYGFVGYPFRKDFPISGYVEMRYDQEQGRVIYQPVTIAPRENTPRIVRDESYGGLGHG